MATRVANTTADKDRADALAQMNLLTILRAYLQSMIDEVPGYKGLLLDKETMRVCSTLYGRSELADHGVVHIERVDQNQGKDHHELKAICFFRPTRENVTHLKRELRAPRYQGYSLFFSNIVNHMYLQDLAEADAAKEQIQTVQEHYADLIVLDPHHFIIPTARPEVLLNPRAAALPGHATAEYEITDRLVQGLSALFLAIRRRPVIRYMKGSEAVHRLADSLYNLVYTQHYQTFDFGSRHPPLVLLLDRADDPVTPLLTQWTYQAMVHDLLGLTDNTVKLTSDKVPEAQRELVLDARSDEFYARHVHSNYGDVGVSVKQMVESFQSTSARHKQVESIEDMRRFMLEHSDFQKTQTSVAKHVNLMSELSENIAKRNLMDVSSAEQELANPAASLSAASSYDETLRALRTACVTDKDKVRLVLLYALRFQSDTVRVRQMADYLVAVGVRDRAPRLFAALDSLLKYAGEDRRAGDLYGSRNLLTKTKALLKGLQGVDNVYTQHTPLLTETLNQVVQNTLPANTYPFMALSQDEVLTWQTMYKKTAPKEVIVFIVGGSTYEEAKAVAEWNEKSAMRVVLGGSDVLNSDAFLDALTAGTDDGTVRVTLN